MLSRRSFFAAPAALAAAACATPALASSAPAAPAMTREAGHALIMSRIDAALAPYDKTVLPKWGEVPDVVRDWILSYGHSSAVFRTPDEFLQHRFKTFFWGSPVGELVRQNKLVTERGRLAYAAQLRLPEIFPLELEQFDQTFTEALLLQNPDKA